MIAEAKKMINHNGLHVYKGAHRSIRKLKRNHSPSVFGYRIWQTSWLLIDFIKQEGFPQNLNVLEVGCGWGLPSIYCAKNYNASVTCLDGDPEVFPFLQLHAEANEVDITPINMEFQDITIQNLTGIDVLLGVEICFWDSMVPMLMNLIDNALSAGVRLILIADPGRTPFETLEKDCLEYYRQPAVCWRIRHPYVAHGRILKIGSLGRRS